MTNDARDFVTADPEMRRIVALAQNVATSRATVLLCGESGSGKEVLARFIHGKSPRAKKRFIAVNCAAIPGELLESELFGYERGAFTGAGQSKPGKFELAHEGTFLLDEISELPILLQAKLLRVIQEGEVERLGSKSPVKVNVRLIATTNRDLAAMVKNSQFREDLFYRLNVIPLNIPPLRHRPSDIELLARRILELSRIENGKPDLVFSAAAINKLQCWAWPGNVRELENVIERSVLLAPASILEASEIHIEGFTSLQTKADTQLTPGRTILEVERELIYKTLEHTNQNRTHAARMLGISIRTLRNKLREYGSEGLSHG
jgi:two-component system response regulator FlrC